MKSLWFFRKGFSNNQHRRIEGTKGGQRWREMPDVVVQKYDSADTRNISELQDLSHFLSDHLWKSGPCDLNSAQI